MDEVHVYMFLQIASTKSNAGSKSRLFCSPFFMSTSWFLILAEALRNDYVAACSTALRSATDKTEMDGYITVPCSSKMTQHNITADCPKF